MDKLFADILFLLSKDLEKLFDSKCYQLLNQIYEIIFIEQSDADCVDQIVKVFDDLEDAAGMPWRELAIMRMWRENNLSK